MTRRTEFLHTHTHTQAQTDTRTHTGTHTQAHTQAHSQAQTDTNTDRHTDRHMHKHTHTQTQAQTQTHTHIQTHRHTRKYTDCAPMQIISPGPNIQIFTDRQASAHSFGNHTNGWNPFQLILYFDHLSTTFVYKKKDKTITFKGVLHRSALSFV